MDVEGVNAIGAKAKNRDTNSKTTFYHTNLFLPSQRWGPYLQVCQWGFNMGKLKCFQIPCPFLCYKYRSLHTVTGFYIYTLQGLGSIPCGQCLDRTLGKFPPIYGPHLNSLFLVIFFGQKPTSPPPKKEAEETMERYPRHPMGEVQIESFRMSTHIFYMSHMSTELQLGCLPRVVKKIYPKHVSHVLTYVFMCYMCDMCLHLRKLSNMLANSAGTSPLCFAKLRDR